MPEEASFSLVQTPDQNNTRMTGTEILFECKREHFGFDFAKGPNFVSFDKEPFIKSLRLLCTNDR